MNRFYRIGCLILLACGAARAADDVVIADFEGPTYGDWKIAGTAFGTAPAQGTLPGQMPVSGFAGHGLANSFHGGDKSTGKLTSPAFAIDHPYISFLIGGGGFAGKTCMNLLVDGKIARTATGINTEPGGSEALIPAGWNVRDLTGKSAVIEIVDQATGGWGHINVDQIVLTNRKPVVIVKNPSRDIVLNSTYLHMPVKTGGPKRKVSVSIDGKIVREFDIELADEKPDFFATLDIGQWKGKTAKILVDQLPDDLTALKAIEQSDEFTDAPDLYHEALRPQFHFSSKIGWLNDPNGLVFYKGEYHLFYQHNPYGHDWGNMQWGHAVSTDLVHWNELPIALYPRQYGDWAFSGSAVVDHANTASFKTGTEDTLVAAFTSTGRGECIVFSNDKGLTWSEFPGNPVVTHNGRDPRLLWHDPSKKWVMAVYDEGHGRVIAFYTSPDLKTWTFASRIDGFFECPDLFELPVDGNVKNTRWVLTAASSEYMIGQFDGTKFTPETPKLPGQRGNAMYAAQTFSDIPASDGRRIQIGWGRGVDAPGMPFSQMMCFPCELTLRTTPDGIRMCWLPVKEVEKIRGEEKLNHAGPIKAGENPLASFRSPLADISADIDPGPATEFIFNIHGVTVRYDAKTNEITCNRSKAKLSPIDGHIRLRILVDRTSVEIFGNDGLVYMPIATHGSNEPSVQLEFKGSDKLAGTLEVHSLNSIWPAEKQATR